MRVFVDVTRLNAECLQHNEYLRVLTSHQLIEKLICIRPLVSLVSFLQHGNRNLTKAIRGIVERQICLVILDRTGVNSLKDTSLVQFVQLQSELLLICMRNSSKLLIDLIIIHKNSEHHMSAVNLFGMQLSGNENAIIIYLIALFSQ